MLLLGLIYILLSLGNKGQQSAAPPKAAPALTIPVKGHHLSIWTKRLWLNNHLQLSRNSVNN